MSRQLDISHAGGLFFSIPQDVPGRIRQDDFFYFNWPESFEPVRNKYQVVVKTLSGTPVWRSIGFLEKGMRVPLVRFDPYATIGVIPDDESLPAFSDILIRGATYTIPDVRGKGNGVFQMTHSGNIH